ncbi:MAG TPA: hypothetical protein VKA91_05730 [Nitrososphaeraceae archaeon]|nr:hypothetical protein [Nitrososphaeraceae archaeon]
MGNFPNNNNSYRIQNKQEETSRWNKFVTAVKEFEASWSKYEISAASKIGKVQERHPIVFTSLTKLLPFIIPSTISSLPKVSISYVESIKYIQALVDNLTSENVDKLIEILKDISESGSNNFEQTYNQLSKEGMNLELLLKNKENSAENLEKVIGVYLKKSEEEKDEVISELKVTQREIRRELRQEARQITLKMEKSEHNLLQAIEKINVSTFVYDLASERLLFYLKLKYLLDKSWAVFKDQNKIAHNLLTQIKSKGHEPKTSKKGLDYALYELHKNSKMDTEDLELFDDIHKVTDNTEKINSSAKGLLINNNMFIKEFSLLRELIIHYSTWQAKYEIYKDDPHMCLIYVGPDQNAGFPTGLDKTIGEIITELKMKIKLDDQTLDLTDTTNE